MQCNINAAGKRIRLIMGLVWIVLGLVVLFVWPMQTGAVLGWIASLVMIAFGGFAIFEARAGWCAVRAMGFKTRI